jgi:hypothetical protein
MRPRAVAAGVTRVAGHYGRPDVFWLTVNKSPHPMLEVETDEGTER